MDVVSKSLVSLGVLLLAGIVAVIVAKIFDHFYDRASIRDDASDVSENTRDLIKARMRAFKRRKSKLPPTRDDKVSKVIWLWPGKGKSKAENPPNVETIIEADVSDASANGDRLDTLEIIDENQKVKPAELLDDITHKLAELPDLPKPHKSPRGFATNSVSPLSKTTTQTACERATRSATAVVVTITNENGAMEERPVSGSSQAPGTVHI